MPTEIKLQLAERMGDIMVALRILAFGAIAFVTLVSPSYAGPCSDDIAKMQARIDAKAHAMAASGSTGAKLAPVRTFNRHRDQSVLPRQNLANSRLERLRLSDKPCCVRGLPTAPVTKTPASKHSRKCNRR